MNWKQSLVKGEVKPHQTSKQELDNIRKLIARDLADASVLALSADRRFATAYNAALQSGTITIACSGYRVSARAGHHAVTFEAAALVLGPRFTDYFEACRRKRNTIDYQNSSVATVTEADELVWNAWPFLYQLGTIKLEWRGSFDGTRQEAYGRTDCESVAAG